MDVCIPSFRSCDSPISIIHFRDEENTVHAARLRWKEGQSEVMWILCGLSSICDFGTSGHLWWLSRCLPQSKFMKHAVSVTHTYTSPIYSGLKPMLLTCVRISISVHLNMCKIIRDSPWDWRARGHVKCCCAGSFWFIPCDSPCSFRGPPRAMYWQSSNSRMLTSARFFVRVLGRGIYEYTCVYWCANSILFLFRILTPPFHPYPPCPFPEKVRRLIPYELQHGPHALSINDCRCVLLCLFYVPRSVWPARCISM